MEYHRPNFRYCTNEKIVVLFYFIKVKKEKEEEAQEQTDKRISSTFYRI